MNSKEKKVKTIYIHQMHIHANTVLYVIINLLSLTFPDYQLLYLYIITKYQTQKASCLIANQ